jgi:excisionase family DNA binding protein
MTQQVTIPEAARLLSVSLGTIRRCIRRGQLPARTQAAGKGHVWPVDLPARAVDPMVEAETQRLQEEIRH